MNTDALVGLSHRQCSTQDLPHSNGASRGFSSLTATQSVLLDQSINSRESQSSRSPPVTLPLTSASSTPPPPPAGKGGHSRQPVCFCIQFIHSSIQYTEIFIYRYIYRISYINLSLLFTAILVWIFHTLSKYKKHHRRMACRVHECLGAWLLATDCIWRSPRRLGGQTSTQLGSLCCRCRDRVGVSLSRAGLRGWLRPPKCSVGRREETQSRPILQG